MLGTLRSNLITAEIDARQRGADRDALGDVLRALWTEVVTRKIDARQRGADGDAVCDGLDSLISISAVPISIKPTELIG